MLQTLTKQDTQSWRLTITDENGVAIDFSTATAVHVFMATTSEPQSTGDWLEFDNGQTSFPDGGDGSAGLIDVAMTPALLADLNLIKEPLGIVVRKTSGGDNSFWFVWPVDIRERPETT